LGKYTSKDGIGKPERASVLRNRSLGISFWNDCFIFGCRDVVTERVLFGIPRIVIPVLERSFLYGFDDAYSVFLVPSRSDAALERI
jgi:hypothetical protein